MVVVGGYRYKCIILRSNETTTTRRDGYFKKLRKSTRIIKLFLSNRFSYFGRLFRQLSLDLPPQCVPIWHDADRFVQRNDKSRSFKIYFISRSNINFNVFIQWFFLRCTLLCGLCWNRYDDQTCCYVFL